MKQLFTAVLFVLFTGIFISAQAQQDYSLSGFSEPALSHYCIGSSVMNHVILADSGSTGIAAGSLSIHWTLSNGTSGTLNGPAASIAADQSDTLELDTFSILRPGAYLLTVYLDSADTNANNDTLRTVIHVSMNGLYTVNPALPAIGNNFQSIAAACDTLSDGGICGLVAIEIADGIYNEQAKIDNVFGVSEFNRIIIRSASQDSSAVRIAYTPTVATDNYVLAINATSFVTIEHLTLESFGSTSFSRVLTIDSTCAFNRYRSLQLTAPATTTNSTALAVIYSNPGAMTNDSMSVFENLRLENGAYGMYLYGASSANPEDSLVIRNNIMTNQYVSGIFMYYQSNTIIFSNLITTSASTSNFSGVYLRYGNGAVMVTRNRIVASGAAGDLIYLRDFAGTALTPILIANNFIFQENNTATLRAIYPYNCSYVDIAFNTIRIQSGNTTSGRALYLNSSSASYGNIRLLNNIAENNGGGYAIEIAAAAITNNYITQCDFNNFTASGTYLGKYGSTNCIDIAAWQIAATANGFDSHSVEIDPIFSGPMAVEFTNSALNGLGTPLTSVIRDIYGTLRNATNPDMGAYEFALLDHDMVVLSIETPISGCGLSNAETVIARFYNNGSMSESNVVTSFSIDGGATWSASEGWFSLNSGDTLTYIFTHTANLSSPGVYNFKVLVTPLSDENMNNNIDSVQISSVISVSSFPYSESFESGSGNWSTGGVNNSWALGEPENTVIDTASAGVNAWVTNLTGNHNLNELSYVQSPCFDLSNMSDPWLEMDIWHEAESGWDGAQVQYSTNGGNTWQTLGIFGDSDWYNDYDVDGIANNAPGWTGADANGSNGWLTVEHSMGALTAFSGIRLRVLFGAGSFNNDEGFAFDNIRISDRGNDAAVNSIDLPSDGCNMGTQSVSFSVINKGTMAISSLPVKISANGGSTWVNDTIVCNIPAEDTVMVSSNIVFDFSAPGAHPMVVVSLLPLDLDITNDTAELTIFNQPLISVFPYFDDVESGVEVWVSHDTLWKPGIPAGSVINTAYSGSMTYSTCHNGMYSSGASGIIESPCFDFSNLSHPQVEFRYFVNADTIFDGATFQYTTDNVIWNNIGNVSDTLNWYNCGVIQPLASISNYAGWSGESQAAWMLARHAMPSLAGQSWVKFRFVFVATNGGNDGIAFDDFSIYEIPEYDIAMIAMDTIDDACEHGLDSITIWMQNTNFANIIPAGDTIVLALNEGWLNVVMDTLVLSAAFMPQQIISHTFSVPLDMTANPYNYNIEVQLYNSHDVESTNNSISQTVESWGYPVIALHADTTMCGNGNILLDAGAGADSYLWSSGAVTQTLLVDTTLSGGYGTFVYTVSATTHGCSSNDEISITFTDCTGFGEFLDIVSVFPNPSQDAFFVIIPKSIGNAILSLNDMTGRLVLQIEVVPETKSRINTAFLPDGVYLLKIISESSNHTQQIIIQR